MSIKLMTRVFEESRVVKSDRLVVLLLLADFANDEGVCWPKIPTIAYKARITEAAASNIVSWLEENGFVNVKRGRGRGHVSLYTVYPKGDSKQDRNLPEKPLPKKPFSETGFQKPLPKKGVSSTCANKEEPSSTKPSLQPSSTLAKDSSTQSIEEIYGAYPRDVGRTDALKAIQRAVERISQGEDKPKLSEGDSWPPIDPALWLLERTKLFSASPKGNAGEYTPYPVTWFNKARYCDGESEWYRSQANQTSSHQPATSGVSDLMEMQRQRRANANANGGASPESVSEYSSEYD